MKRCSMFLTIRDLQIKTTMRYNLTLVRMVFNNNIKEDAEKLGVLVHCCLKCKMVQLLWKTVWSLLKNLKIKLAYNPASWLMGIYPKELKSESQGVISTSTFSVTHSSQDVETTSLSNDRRMNKENVICTYNVVLFILTKGGNSTICVNKDEL